MVEKNAADGQLDLLLINPGGRYKIYQKTWRKFDGG